MAGIATYCQDNILQKDVYSCAVNVVEVMWTARMSNIVDLDQIARIFRLI